MAVDKIGVSRFLNRKNVYALTLRKEGHSWNYILEDLEEEFSYLTIDGEPITGSQARAWAKYVIQQAKMIEYKEV
jgi:hypothetical protein